MRIALSSLLLLAACGGSTTRTQPELPPLPPPGTRATLAGPLCEGDTCKCRGETGDPGTPDSKAVKRYEIEIGPVDNEMWVTVDDMVLYKSRERATECFYVDLTSPGEHKVTIRAHGEPAFGARVTIREIGVDPKSYYDTFTFGCGGPGACDQPQLRDWRDGLRRYTRGVHDPCGSTKIKGIEWDTGEMPDATLPSDLYVKLVLQPYAFAPKHPSGDPACSRNF